MTKRYTAIVKVIEIEEAVPRGTGRGDDKTIKQSQELLDIEVRASSLANIVAKIKGHVDLELSIEEDM